MPDVFKVPVEEIDRRITGVQAELTANGIDALFIVQRVDLFYFSGTAQNGILFIPAEGAPLLMIKKYLPRARQEAGIRHILGMTSIKEIPGLLLDFYGRLPKRIGFEFDVLPVHQFNFYRTLFPDGDLVDGSLCIHNVRMIKSAWEIEQLTKTAALSRKTFEYMQTAIQPGLTEMAFAGIFEAYARKIGHAGMLRARHFQDSIYTWHVLSGKSGGRVGLLDAPASGEGTSAAFPSGGGKKSLIPGEPIMVDFGFVHNGYHLDETRMFAIGSMPAEAMTACRAAIEIHDAVLEMAKPGVAVGALFDFAWTQAEKHGYGEVFLGPPGYKVKFVGHGIGTEMVELPIIAKGRRDPLKSGMIFALEPKMVFENRFSAGIESVFRVTENGSRLITQIPVDVFIC